LNPRTIKYTPDNFEAKAVDAIEQAIVETQQEGLADVDLDQHIGTFLLAKRALLTKIHNENERNIYDLGEPFGFNLLTDFSGLRHMYLGNFTALRTEVVIWRLHMLSEVLDERFNTLPERIKLGLATTQHLEAVNIFRKELQVWVIVSTDQDRDTIKEFMTNYNYTNVVYSLSDVEKELESLNESKGVD